MRTPAQIGADAWTLIPLIAVERADKWLNDQSQETPYPTNISGESADVSMANAVVALKGGGRVLTSNAGIGGASYTQITKGGSNNTYQSLLNEVTIATQMNVGYGVLASIMTHGETDAAVTFYPQILLVYQANLEADVQAITGQSRSIPLIYSQFNTLPAAQFGAVTGGAALGMVLACQMGTSLVKTSPTVGSTYDAGAVSTASLAGNGYLETTIFFDVTPDPGVVGLSHTFTGLAKTNVDFGINFNGVVAEVWEGGSLVHTGPNAKAGDAFRITFASGIATYSQNGTVFYTSGSSPTFPLFVQTGTATQYKGFYKLKLSTAATLGPWTHNTGMTACDGTKLFLSGPKYHLPYFSDRTHLLPLGYQLLGEQYARVQNNLLGAGWTNFVPTSTVRVGNVITVTFSASSLPLVFDGAHTAPHLSGTYAAWANGKGFEARSGGINGTIVTINSVAIANGNQVVITCATAPDFIAYAKTPDVASGPTGGFPDGRCGLLRDSDSFIGPITGIAQPNWCPEFYVTGL